MSLTELNYYVRKFAPILIIFSLVLLVLFLAVQLLFLYMKTINKSTEPSEEPVVIVPTFNNIKAPIIPKSKPSNNYTYVLDTLDGTPLAEHATNAATIYFFPKPTATFGFLPQVYLMATTAGINTEVTPHKLSDNRAVFDDGKNKLQVDINTFNFTYDFVLNKDDLRLTSERITASNELQSAASNYLSKMGRYPEELAQGNKNIIYLHYNADTNQITTLDTQEGSNMAEIDFYRPDLNGLPVVTSSYYNSPHYVLYGIEDTGLRVIRAQISMLEKSEDQTGTYPLRKSDQAWEDLQNGRGYVVSSTQNEGQVVIKKIFLAYYDPDVYQEYFQPVYVFLGDNKFVAYVPAVTDEYLLKN